MVKSTTSRQTRGTAKGQAEWEKWAKGLEIREIAADSVEFRVDRTQLAQQPQPTVQVQYRLDPKDVSTAKGAITMLFDFELLMTTAGRIAPPSEPFLRVRLAYHATYSLPAQPPTDDEKLKRFQKQIAAAHVLPFVRAQLTDLIMRAGLPPLYLPLAHPDAHPAK